MNRLASLLAVATLFVGASCDNSQGPGEPVGSDPATETYAASLGVNIASMTKLSRDLYYSDLVVGTGATVSTGSNVSLTYTGWLVDGTQVQSNVGKAPLVFTVGSGTNIAGWDQGIPGMKVGGTRLLVIGSNLAYGTQGANCSLQSGTPFCTVPKNSTLVYKIQVVSSP